MDGVDTDPMALYGGLLLRLSRSVSERDALEVVTHWSRGKGELVVLPLKRRHHHNTQQQQQHSSSSSTISRLATPLDLELYVESGNVHAKVSMHHEFGLHLRTNLESNGLKKELSTWNTLIMSMEAAAKSTTTAAQQSQSSTLKKMSQIQYESLSSAKFTNPKPWIFVDADVVERINFGTGSSVRTLHVNLPEDKNSGYVKKW